MNQAWHLYSNLTTLWAQVLKAKYFSHAILFTSPWTSWGSHIWTVLSLGAKLLLESMRWIVRDGQTIRVWKDPWLPISSLCSYIEGPFLPHDEDRRVNLLWLNHSWSFDSLNLPLSLHLQNLIQSIPVAWFAQLMDTFLWPHNKGMCSVKSTSKFLFPPTTGPLEQIHVELALDFDLP